VASTVAVVNDHVKSEARAFPAVSLTPFEPDRSVTVYAVAEASAALGCSVAVEPLAEIAAGTMFPPPSRSAKVVPVTLAAEMGSLNVALTLVPTLTLAAPFGGVTAVTLGGVVSGGTVVNDHVKSAASAFPAMSLIPPEPERSVAVYVVPGCRLELGCSVALDPLLETVAAMAVPLPSRREKVVPFTLAAEIGSPKVALTLVPRLTFVAPLAGVTLATVGGVVSTARVVNDQLKFDASAFPAASLIPLAPERSVAVYEVDDCRFALGVSVAVPPLADTVAGTVFPPPSRSTKVVPVTLAVEIGSLKVALTFVPRLTLAAPFAGVTLVTVGGVVSARLVTNTTSTQ
jgi:hypothetical protein